MNSLVGIVLVILLLLNLLLLGTGRIRACIRVVAVQGVLMSLLPVFASFGVPTMREIAVAAMSASLKGFAFPWLLYRAVRGSGMKREVEPIVGYSSSILVGLLALGISFWMASKAPLAAGTSSPLALPVALATICTGMFVIVGRRKALMQLLGYIVLENGIFAFGFAMEIHAGLLVEMGIIIDALMAVLVMGVAIFHMHRELDSDDMNQLSSLTEMDA